MLRGHAWDWCGYRAGDRLRSMGRPMTRWVWVTVAAFVVLAAAGGGAGWYWLARGSGDAAPAPVPEVVAPPTLPLEGRLRATLTGHAGVVEGLAFAPDGKIGR